MTNGQRFTETLTANNSANKESIKYTALKRNINIILNEVIPKLHLN